MTQAKTLRAKSVQHLTSILLRMEVFSFLEGDKGPRLGVNGQTPQ